jgi:spore germination protein YaaH
MRPWLFGIATIVLISLAAVGGWFWYVSSGAALLTPSAGRSDVALSSLQNRQFIVYGFAPYWNLSKTIVQPELTHLAYFSLPITEDGELDGISNGKPTDSDADISSRRWRSELLDSVQNQLNDQQTFTVTLTQFNAKTIETFLSSPSAQTRFQSSLSQFLHNTTRPVKGINIDIEYPGDAEPELRADFVRFLQRTRLTVDEFATTKKVQPFDLSVSVYANAASHQQLWDLDALTPYVDHIVVMAYDFHRSSSPIAGPVAPMFGAKQIWDNDLVLHMKEFLQKMPSEKILLGIPFYGYEWETTVGDARSLVYPGTGATASYSRVQRLLTSTNAAEVADGPITQGWDEDALSPYVIYTKDDRQHVIYYEDARSIGFKLQLAKELNLGGVAIWALGYEDRSRELWNAFQTELTE